jgi:pimeloyl-ACP methyl ester carboxylesterase
MVSYLKHYLEAYSGLLPNARTLTIKAAGHVPQVEQPVDFVDCVREFLGD